MRYGPPQNLLEAWDMTAILLPLSTFLSTRPRSAEDRIDAFTTLHGRPPDENTTLFEWVQATSGVRDLLRLLHFTPNETAGRVRVYVATRAARRVLHIFEERYPDDARPRHAIEVAEKWLENPESVRGREFVAVREDARAAADAILWGDSATVTDAAYAALCAAEAAYTAAWAADVADGSAAAAAAAAYTADAVHCGRRAERAAQRQDFLFALGHNYARV